MKPLGPWVINPNKDWRSRGGYYDASGTWVPRLYPAVTSDDWIQPVRRNYGMACCDCGLVHRLDFRIKNGRVQLRARRDNRATAQLRRRPEYRGGTK